VLLAGLGDTAQLYRGLAPKLVRKLAPEIGRQPRVVALTRRGHGRSDRPVLGYDLQTFVRDICRFLDEFSIERAILVGHSYGGIEATLFARLHPERVEALVYLDALFPVLDPEPDLSGDPVWSVIPTGGPTGGDLSSREAYLAYCRRARPAWARLWCKAIEADLMDKVTIRSDGRLEYHHDDALMNRIYRDTWASRRPDYAQIRAPMLAIVPDGDFHQACPPDAPPELRQAADQFWKGTLLPWIRQRTAAFLKEAPGAQVVKLDSPYHHIHIAKETETAEAILDFLAR
jgi:pimeloyl-ACP methyl ester carboxylesterase